ncbi:hypothetical protein PENSPDRAFT_650915 [Peniophora sp. CONT]|nr:hypothetical protein PENSPDRAFT_650915 [Peniophora sp. CONT]
MLLPALRAHPRRLSLVQPMVQLRKQSTVSLLDTHPVVQTFHPKRLQSSDYLDLSLQTRYSLLVRNPSSAPGSPPRRVQMQYQTTPPTPFPPDTRGFFYYSADGMLRFRLAESSSPTDFAKGRDLELPNGVPWRIDARRINTFAKWSPIRDLILSSPISATSTTTRGYAPQVHDGMNPVPARANVIAGFGEPFLFNFAIANTSMYVRRPDGELHAFKFRNPLADWKQNALGMWAPVRPWYYGNTLCAFEPSPFSEDAGTPTIVLRLLRILPAKLVPPGVRRSLSRPLSPLPFGPGDLVAKRKGQDGAWRFKTGPNGDMSGALHRLWELPRAVSPVLAMPQGAEEGSRGRA